MISRWTFTFILGGVGALLGACSSDGNDEDKGEQQASHIQCCTIRAICTHCRCDSNPTSIGNSGNEEACKSYLDQGDWGCYPTSSGPRYEEDDALADCT